MANLTARNTEAFVYGRLLGASALAFDLSAGVVRAQMRRSVDSPVVLYEWSTADGSITLAPVKATGFVQYVANPLNGDTLTIGETVVTFVASGPGARRVLIAPDLDDTMANLRTVLAGSTDWDLAAHDYAVTDSRLNLLAKQAGPLGNLMTLKASTSGAQVSAPTLVGGGTRLGMTAPQSRIARFEGAFVYDVRFEDPANPSVPAVLFGGTLTFLPGVTR